jgi:molybdopterin-binding protein
MKLSTRNMLIGRVAEIEIGVVNVVVKIDLGGGQMLSSMITLDACKDLDLKIDDEVFAIAKSSSIIIGKV